MRHSQADGRDEVKSCRRYSVPGLGGANATCLRKGNLHTRPTTGEGGMNGQVTSPRWRVTASDEPAFVVAFL